MKEGDVALMPLPQADGAIKIRPVILLREMPRFGDFLLCGVSTQLGQYLPAFDEFIMSEDDDFSGSGLKASSLIRLAHLAVIPKSHIHGVIGSISSSRHQRLLKALALYLLDQQVPE